MSDVLNRSGRLTSRLQHHHKIAYICSPRLGDSLIGLVMVNNLVRNGFVVDVYGEHIYQLADWFVHMSIFSANNLQVQDFQKYDFVFHMYPSEFSKQLALVHQNSIVFSDNPLYRAKIPMVDIQVKLCEQELQLLNIVRTNGLTHLPELSSRKNANKIIIHPSSFLPRKNWPATKFVKLARLLQKENYKIEFMVSPAELPDWHWLETKGFVVHAFSSLSSVASLLFESGFFIGNDSGVGHLASNLGVPTLTIILRKGVAIQWRPSWSVGKIVLSPSWLNPRPVKEKLWKLFTTVNKVKKTFDQLVMTLKNTC